MTHDILSTVLSNRLEWLVFLLGGATGLLLAWLWRSHRDAALFLLGFVVAMTLGRNTSTAGRPYWMTVHRRPLATKPWYFLSGMVLVAMAVVPVARLLERRRRGSAGEISPDGD